MTALCNAHEGTFWPGLRWLEFAAMAEKQKVVIVLPITGFADWGLDLPLNVEETMSMSVLREASQQLYGVIKHLVLPPLRFVLGPTESSFFATDPDTAHETLREMVISIKESGFRKVVFYNSSPWNEAFLNVAGRDLRIELGMQMFSINLAGIGLDLKPDRSTTRDDCRILGANQASDRAKSILEKSAGRLVALLKEVAVREPLPNDGEIPTKQGDEG
ncbi:MAG: creatininase family protein [Verrucomicrobia bacterium]|nr:creatininase family protein [Verrucomicrobiota bacterium]